MMLNLIGAVIIGNFATIGAIAILLWIRENL